MSESGKVQDDLGGVKRSVSGVEQCWSALSGFLSRTVPLVFHALQLTFEAAQLQQDPTACENEILKAPCVILDNLKQSAVQCAHLAPLICASPGRCARMLQRSCVERQFGRRHAAPLPAPFCGWLPQSPLPAPAIPPATSHFFCAVWILNCMCMQRDAPNPEIDLLSPTRQGRLRRDSDLLPGLLLKLHAGLYI